MKQEVGRINDPAHSPNPPNLNERDRLRTSMRLYQRAVRFDCGCGGAWCRCDHRDNPTARRTDAYLEAIAWLEAHQLAPAPLWPELRELWRRGGKDRAVAGRIAISRSA